MSERMRAAELEAVISLISALCALRELCAWSDGYTTGWQDGKQWNGAKA